MTHAALLVLYCAGGALLQLQTLSWTPDKSTCFVADATMDGIADIFVVEEYGVRVYGRWTTEPLFAFELPPNTSALDVADVDRDGTADLVAVCGDKILQYPLRKKGGEEPKTLFTLENQFSRTAGFPFPSVLVVDRDHQPLIALPRDQALDICDLDGKVVESYPISVQTPYQMPEGRPFNFAISSIAQAGPSTALEFRISSVVSFKSVSAEDSLPVDIDTAGRIGTSRQQWEADNLDPESWPWFPVGPGAAGNVRALYRTAGSRASATAIRIRTLPDPDSDNPVPDRIGPARQYPGTLLVREGNAPDFDGDGFTDILLWKSQEPSFTADTLARAAARKTWPLSITSHLFLPEKQRFAPKPGSNLTVDVPLAWLLAPSRFGPLRVVILRDFDGDGKIDFGCLTAEDTLTVWRAEENGLAREPAFQHRFSASVKQVLFETDLEGEGRTSVGLRAGNHLHILRPWSPLSDL